MQNSVGGERGNQTGETATGKKTESVAEDEVAHITSGRSKGEAKSKFTESSRRVVQSTP